MSENFPKSGSSIDLSPISGNMGGSPKVMYTYFLLSLARNYFEDMRAGDAGSIERSTAALIAFLPNASKREELWDQYVKERDSDKFEDLYINASVHTVGALISYLSDLLEFEEKSTGGLM